MIDIHQQNKQLIGQLRAALYDIDKGQLKKQLNAVFAPDCEIHLAFPFEDLAGPDGLYDVYRGLLTAVPDLERRDFIFMAGEANGDNWVGCGGHYVGLFENHWLDIPPTQHLIFMRYHEFFRIEENKIVEMQALWDIPQLMMQANAWPMTPSLGVECVVPGPAMQDGIITAPYDKAKADASVKLVLDMVSGLKNSPQGAEAMELDRFWHPKMNWYGPAGIGSTRRLSGFRSWHQIPFLKAMPDRTIILDKGVFFGDGDYVGFTAWPVMWMTVSGDGWLGIAPANQKITMRSLDFWRHENGRLRENWVLVDILDVYNQLDVDVFSRMKELTVARQPI
ncbi:ester cyclase [Candidatus Leptofilum sp.]|uniref:ester cyclase n=1 Tax=Candidatus Leptofilum sp. TaxID=3241576 RepID=UPI003B5A473A